MNPRLHRAALLLARQVHQAQLNHAQEVVARESILVEHLKHELVLVGLDTENELFIPLWIEGLKSWIEVSSV